MMKLQINCLKFGKKTRLLLGIIEKYLSGKYYPVISVSLAISFSFPVGALALRNVETDGIKNDFSVNLNSKISPTSVVYSSLMIAQTQSTKSKLQKQGNQILQEGIQLLNSGKFKSALSKLQQALQIYKQIDNPSSEGAVLIIIGTIYSNLRESETAIKYYQQSLQTWQRAINLYQQNKNKKQEVYALRNLAKTYFLMRNFSKAIEYYQQTLTIARHIREFKSEEISLQHLADIYLKQKNYTKAIEYYQQTLVLARKNQDKKAEIISLFNIGISYENLKNLQQAIEYYQQTLTVARQIQESKIEEISLRHLGNIYLKQKNYTKAIEYYQQTLVLARKNQDKKAESIYLFNIGLAYKNLKNLQQAIENYQQILRIAPQIQESKIEEIALRHLGDIYLEQENYFKAIEFYQQSLVLARNNQDKKAQIHSLGNIGIAYEGLKNFPKAIEYLQESLKISRKMKERKNQEISLRHLGDIYLKQENYAKAIEYYEQALSVLTGIKDTMRLLRKLGDVYYLIAEYDKAIKYNQASLVIARKITNKTSERRALNSLGNIYYFLNQTDKAIKYYEQVLAIARSQENRQAEGLTLGNIALAYTKKGYYDKAIEYLQQDLAITREFNDEFNQAQTLGHLGLAYFGKGKYSQAIEYYQQALAITQQLGYTRGEGVILTNLGRALFQFGKLSEAEKTLRNAIKVRESLRKKLGERDAYKVSIFEHHTDTYTFLQEVLIVQNKINEALEVSENGRAKALIDLLAAHSQQIEIKSPSISSIQKIAKQQQATLVEYSVVDTFTLYIWVIKPTGEIAFKEVDLKSIKIPLNELVSTTRTSMGVRSEQFSAIVKQPLANPQEQTKKLQQLHQLLIKPIAQLLPTNPNSRVIFIPHQDLFLAPFPALINAEGKYLIEKHTILTAPSIQVLALTKEQRQKLGNKTGEYLVVGNPSPMPPGFKPLKGAEKEAKAIAKLLNTKPLIGSQATEPIVTKKLPLARVIHLATHGTFNEVQPRESGIALAPSGSSDGMLTAGEIFDSKVKLNAELVVLSACDTGRGRITGDGVIGLSRSLISAGAPSVLISLWQVPDAATAELMTEFYTNVYKKKLDKAQGLRQAMLKVMKKHPNYPKAWAAFTLIGEAE